MGFTNRHAVTRVQVLLAGVLDEPPCGHEHPVDFFADLSFRARLPGDSYGPCDEVVPLGRRRLFDLFEVLVERALHVGHALVHLLQKQAESVTIRSRLLKSSLGFGACACLCLQQRRLFVPDNQDLSQALTVSFKFLAELVELCLIRRIHRLGCHRLDWWNKCERSLVIRTKRPMKPDP
ncbi:hypothetical protein AB0J42_25855 [Nonomuraea sp. NPDC049649]|uniref:hypothetical protein n=1 Tax=Nonomuraea sp. NPDC049649 TaxID=3155776 RepID=UPI003441DC6F